MATSACTQLPRSLRRYWQTKLLMKNTFKYRSLVAFLLFALGEIAQGQLPATDGPAFTAQGAFVAIVVTDLDASVHWYEANLGLHLVKRGKSPRLPAETVVLGGHDVFVELIHHVGKQLPRVDDEASVPRLIKAGVIVAQRDFDAVATYLQKRGVEAGVFEDKEMGVRSFLFSDNDGNLIQFFTQDQ
jgi:catechol 2,3-dioxygenase-like lactoylglutathione lyase family enzyme